MIIAAELAGFLAAHAVWCVSDGDTLIPLLAFRSADDERTIHRLAMDDLAVAVEFGKEKLAGNEHGAAQAVLVYDGFVPIEGERRDAIILELRDYATADARTTIAVPYHPISSGSFRVGKPRLLVWEHCQAFPLDEAIDSFLQGVAGHEKGSALWNRD